jgi:hypothetical protein
MVRYNNNRELLYTVLIARRMGFSRMETDHVLHALIDPPKNL